MSEEIEIIERGPQGPIGPQGPQGPSGATFDQDLNTTDAVTFASVNAPLYDAALSQDGASIDDGVLNIHGASGTAKLDTGDLTGARSHYLPDESGHLALTENTATAAQGALAASAVQPNSGTTLSGLDIIDDNPSVRIAQSAISGDDVVVNDLSVKFGDGTYTHTLQRQGTLAANATFTLPVSTGTLALTSQIPSTFAASAITSGTLDAARVPFSAPGAIGSGTASTGAFTSLSATSLSVASGALTASAPFDFSQTWNNSGVTFTGRKTNITDTASASGSLIDDWQVGGVSKFKLLKSGQLQVIDGTKSSPAFTFISNTSAGGMYLSQGTVAFASNGTGVWIAGTTGMALNSSTYFGWSTDIDTTAASLRIYFDAANTFAQRNGTNAQESRVYATYTSSTNYQRGTVKCVKQTLSALSGASATTTGTFIPDGAVVVGVTTRVGTAITGATSYSVGDGSDVDRWGGSIGVALNTTSDNRDWTAGTVECFTSGGNITLTANGSNFTGGAVEICVFYLAGEAD